MPRSKLLLFVKNIDRREMHMWAYSLLDIALLIIQCRMSFSFVSNFVTSKSKLTVTVSTWLNVWNEYEPIVRFVHSILQRSYIRRHITSLSYPGYVSCLVFTRVSNPHIDFLLRLFWWWCRSHLSSYFGNNCDARRRIADISITFCRNSCKRTASQVELLCSMSNAKCDGLWTDLKLITSFYLI